MKTRLLSLLFVLFAAQFAGAQTANKKAANMETVKSPDLKAYKGSYTTKDNNDTVAIFVAGDKLMCKIPGRPSMALDAAGKNVFKSDKEGVTVEFNSAKNEFVLTDNGIKRTYTKG